MLREGRKEGKKRWETVEKLLFLNSFVFRSLPQTFFYLGWTEDFLEEFS
jgi:hypothetical protein